MRRAPNGLYQSFAMMRPGAANQCAVDVKKHERVGLHYFFRKCWIALVACRVRC